MRVWCGVFLGLLFAVVGAGQDFDVKLVSANPEAGYNFPYVLRVPKGEIPENRRYLVVESNNGGVSDDFEHQIQSTLTFVSSSGIGPLVADRLGVPLLVPVFPRTQVDWRTYTHALDRDTLLIQNDPRQRLDQQLLRMVDDARKQLYARGTPIRDKFAIVGFSASGTFSNRFAFLHPERLCAVVSGGVNAFPMLPVAELDGQRLDYPLGVADLEELTGQAFKNDDWRSLPQMIFMGALDENDAVEFDDAYSEQERQLIHQHLGREMSKRWLRAQSIYLDVQANVVLTTYGQVGHGTDGLINGDIVNFVDVMMRREYAKTNP